GRIDVRGRLHAVWVVAHAGGAAAAGELFALAQRDPDPRVQAQAIRACSDLADPVLSQHRLNAESGDGELSEKLSAWAEGKDARVLREVVIALGRLQWRSSPGWLQTVLA